MAQYDGSIRINTNIITKGAKESLSSLAQAIVGTAERISSLKAKMKALENQKTPTEEYQSLDDYIKSTEASVERLTSSMRRMEESGLQDSDVYRDTVNTIEEMNAELERSKARMQELVDTGRAFEFGSDSEEYRHLQEEIENEEKALKKLVLQYQALNVAEKTISGFQKVSSAAKNMFSKIIGSAGEIEESISSMSERLKNLALSFLVFKKLGEEVGSFVEEIEESFENFYSENDRFKKSIDDLKSSVLTLKNAFEAAFSPLVQIAVPYIQKAIEYLTLFMDKIGQFIAAITGQKTYTKAIKQTTSAIKDQNKAQNRQLSSLDKLNNLTSDKGGGGDDGGVGSMFEEAPVDNKFIELANKIKEILSQIFQPLKTAWENQGKFVMDSWKYALEEIGLLSKSVGKDFLEVWNQSETISVLENILIIIGDIGLVVGNLVARFREAWEANDIGLHILKNIRDIFATIIEHIRNAADYTVEWSEKLDFTPLLESINGLLEALKPLTDNIGAGLEWFWNNVLLPITGWTIEDAIPVFLNMLSAAISVLNEVISALQPLGQWFWDNFLQPLGEWAGGAIISAMQTITDLLTKFSDWISEHQEIIETLTIIIGSFAAAWGVVTVAVTAWNVVAGIAAGVTTALGAAVAFLTSPIGLIILAIGALIAIGVLLYKNWDTIAAKAKEVWEFIKQKFQEFDDWLQSVFETDWTESFGAFGKILNIFFDVASDIWDSIKQIFSGFIEFLAGVFTGDWDRAWNGIVQIFEGVKNAIKGIVNGILSVVESLANGVVNGINIVIGALNNLHFDIPDWVPALGGKTFGFNIPELSQVSIPRLATGAVIPANREFMAVLGDQKHGRNLEAPEDLIRKIVREESGGGGVKEITLHVPIEFEGNVLIDIIQKLDLEHWNRTGRPLLQM